MSDWRENIGENISIYLLFGIFAALIIQYKEYDKGSTRTLDFRKEESVFWVDFRGV